ncbi:MAG: hypothetical protein HYS23_10980 [Geobacter sp.]|nr:hypothetical protein [Geobacter sp.]
MKTRISIMTLLMFLLATFPVHAADTARIITRENAIREDCRFFAPVKAKVRYNDTVTILSRQGDWFRVSFRGVKGCLHKSAVAEKKFSLGSMVSTPAGSTSSEEVALAGKGFNPQVESSYKSSHPELDFQAVDAIERYGVEPEDLAEFIRKGGLNPP